MYVSNTNFWRGVRSLNVDKAFANMTNSASAKILLHCNFGNCVVSPYNLSRYTDTASRHSRQSFVWSVPPETWLFAFILVIRAGDNITVRKVRVGCLDCWSLIFQFLKFKLAIRILVCAGDLQLLFMIAWKVLLECK